MRGKGNRQRHGAARGGNRRPTLSQSHGDNRNTGIRRSANHTARTGHRNPTLNQSHGGTQDGGGGLVCQVTVRSALSFRAPSVK